MNKSVYKVVVDCFHSYWLRINYLPCFNVNNYFVNDLHFDKVNSLSELIENFNKLKIKYKSEFEEFYNLDCLECFIEEYDKMFKISEKYKGQDSLIFSILFGFLVDFDYIQKNERTFTIIKKTGEIVEKRQVLSASIKGEKNIERYRKLLDSPLLRAEKKPGIFLIKDAKRVNLPNFEIKDYVLTEGKKTFIYLPDYAIIAILLYSYAKEICNKNTKLLIKGEKKLPRMHEYAKIAFPNKSYDEVLDLSDFERKTGIYEETDEYLEFFNLKDIRRLEKICDEIYECFERDKKESPYFDEYIFEIYSQLKNLKWVVSEMNGSLMIPASDFFAMGGQLEDK